MSRKNRRNKVPQVDVARTELSTNGPIATFAEKKGIDLKNSNDLMNWIIFGEKKEFYSTPSMKVD